MAKDIFVQIKECKNMAEITALTKLVKKTPEPYPGEYSKEIYEKLYDKSVELFNLEYKKSKPKKNKK